jgi:TonB family protein
MATETARIQLELASGKNEITAPFNQTAERKRQRPPPEAASASAPAPARVARPPWIAFVGALLAVAAAVWWVMSERMPDIDPREVITRNLDDARVAMADGRYTDPPERSAIHYYSTVLALDPANSDAMAGIDSIAEHHLAQARTLLADQQIAEAGVALEKARRVRPDHVQLEVLEARWRAELRKLVAANTNIANSLAEPVISAPMVAKAPQSKEPRPAGPTRVAIADSPRLPTASPSSTGSKTFVEKEPSAPIQVAALDAAAAALAATRPLPRPEIAVPPVPAPETSTPNVINEPAPAPRSAEPKLIKMVQPQYPQEALMRGFEGWVDVSVQVSPSGDVIDPRIEASSRGRMFNRAALSAVQQWKYEPNRAGATSERVRVRVRFQQAK